MKKQLSKISLTLLICIPLLMVLVDSAGAQTPTTTPTSLPTPTLPPTPTLSPTLISPSSSGVVKFENPDIVTFSQLNQGEIQLNGPYDRTGFSFATPADWVLKDNVQLNLLMGISFNTNLQNQDEVVVVGGGTLTVLFNSVVLVAAPLNQVGEVELKINIPFSALPSSRSDGRMELVFILDSGLSCRVAGLHTIVFSHPTSFFSFPHDFSKPPTSLINFPRPIYQNSFLPESALLVIPDQPTAAELQAALTVAAGLGNLSSNRLLLDMTTLSNLREDLTKRNLIFIGKAASLPLLDGLNLPLPSAGGQFQIPGGTADDGLIEMINSPWSSSHVVLVVSANTDPGVVKAAQAVSSGVIRPNQFENLAVIDQVNTLPISGPQAVDRTISDLGYEFRSFQGRGVGSEEYIFNIPAGMTVSPEAYFDMIYGHSSLLDYNTSQIVILLNDQPIGSVRMSDTTAAVPTNHVKIMLPPSAVVPGNNTLSVRVLLEPIDDCTNPITQGLWLNIWPQSLIHVPLIETSFNPVISPDLSAYPTPFIYNSTLGSTAFILERNNLESWRNAMQIAASLGSRANGPVTQLSVFYGDAMPATERPKYHLLVIGRPSQLPIVGEMNDYLPASFSNGVDIASETGNFQITYRIPPDSPMGYIETMLSPWNSENVVLAILGNTTQGVNWAATALVDPTLVSQVAGSFAAVNNKQIISSNSRYVENSSADSQPTEIPSMIATPLVDTTTDLSVTRPKWILPVLIVSIGLIALIVVMVAIRNQSRLNTRKQGKEEQEKESGEDSSKLS